MKGEILLADNSPDDAYLIQRAFKSGGWEGELHVVHDGTEAIKYLQGADCYSDRSKFKLPDLLLLDLNMPCGGFVVLAWVNSQPDLKNLPVIILSDSVRIEDVNKAYRLGAHSYFEKTNHFRDVVDFCLSMCQYCVAVKGHLDAKIPARVWPSEFRLKPFSEAPAKRPCFPCAQRTETQG